MPSNSPDSQVPLYSLHLLGAPFISTPTGKIALERKTTALLAYLAVEGLAHKYKLAGWLWPDSGETAARNNMRQLLRRLRLSGADVVVGQDQIELRPEVKTDIHQLSYLEAPTLELLSQDVALLEGLDYDEAPDFAEWLESVREELRELRSGAAKAEAERLEGLGNFRQALEYAQIALRLEPLSEEAHRQVIRLYYLLGDWGAALAAFERLKSVLAEELGTTPLPETLELIRTVERGAELGNTPSKPKSAIIPAAVLRPPVLAGREREWEQMERAWDAGQYIAIGGEGGSGKTRLMLDFIYSKVPKEAVLHLQARPGDAAVPYSSHARNYWQMIQQFKPNLEPWTVRELARIIPELGESPGPIGSPAEKLRFYQAKIEAMKASIQKGLRVLASDDVQYTDAASAEAAFYMMGAMGTAGGLAAVYCYRPSELSPLTAEVFAQSVGAGLLAMIDLEPLGAESIETLLEGLGLDETENLVPGLSRYTGGNPQFVLETLKYLMETGNLERGLPARLAPLGHVAALIGRRLERLSPTALNLARVAAVAGTLFTLELAAYVLERPSLELIETVSELEAAQILKGTSFTHDLVFEAVLAGIPSAVKPLLHARAARYLEGVRANPNAVARHWLEAGQPVQAVPWLLAAARLADANGLYREGVEAYGRAVEILEAHHDAAQAASVRLEMGRLEARAAVG